LDIRNYTTVLSTLDPTHWIIAASLALGSYVLMHAGVALFRRRLCRIEEQQQTERPITELLKATLARTSKLALLATALLIGLTALDLPAPWDERVRHLWFITLGAQLALYLDRAVSVAARRYFKSHAAEPDAPTTVANTLMVWAVKTALWIMFALAMLSNLGINVSTFIASLGIGGIAIALAVQNILGDLFASLSIAVDKPFEVGDSISVAGVSGSVEHVGLKTTRVRADSGEQIVIANAELLKNTLRNFKRMSTRRVQIALALNPATDPELAAGVPALLREIIEQQKGVRFDRAHLKTVTQHALEFEMVFYVLDPAYARFMDSQQAILLDVLRAFKERGISSVASPQSLLLQESHGSAAAVRSPLTAVAPHRYAYVGPP
jgi:small-conductance mechanosensitive channel